jgi:hypothetical protein
VREQVLFSNLFSSFVFLYPVPAGGATSLTRALLNSIRCRVADARLGKLSLVKLATLIWAAEEFLYAKAEMSQSLKAETLVPVRSLEAAERLLARLGDDPSSTQLCRALAQVLPFLDVTIGPNALLVESDQEISLESLQEGSPVLRGTVQVWLREPPLLKRLRDQRRGSFTDHAMKYLSLTRSQLRCLSFYLMALP